MDEGRGGASVRNSLDRGRILEAALRLLDEGGPGALSMRQVAAVLAVTPMALYRHVRDKDELLEWIVEARFASLDVPEAGSGSWTERVRGIAFALHHLLHAHPNLATLLSQQPFFTPAAMRPHEAMHAALRDAGFGEEAAARAATAIYTTVLGRAMLEAALAASAATPQGGAADRQRYVGLAVAALRLDQAPRSAQLAGYVATLTSEDLFAYTLERLIAGLLDELGRR